ncbi:PBS lyase HEAT domain protein repeat-containing protein [Rippkaea orientalis PCC 8801]|uniref:PBS lyase HEAT domain protein repeat-containing protein n=1 Tax=Rippkaea orientalis (strain PCC 8801 / RF-1) TaxID=41431 RepID=B7JZR6_RIPO1|nr:HEAT repeat domain-containing protein [Rippkaea orientalis]ACK65009.1 PBS lyase HEAT domain protein repeat-containing protein [Rippkaea orientalis PCC 8801]
MVNPESVQELLTSDNFGDRIKGLNQLRQLPPDVAFPLLQPLINDTNDRVRYAAVSQLDPLGKEDLGLALRLLRDRLLNDSELDVKAAAADAMGGLKLTEAYEDLQQVYEGTSDWVLQMSIVAALGELGDPRGFDLLQTALNSDNGLLRTAAVSALGELGNPKAVSVLIPLVNDEDWQIRYRLAQALGRLGGQEAEIILNKLAEDAVEQVAQEATSYLKST